MNIAKVSDHAKYCARIRLARAFGAAVIILCAAWVAGAQTYTGRILGTVTDKSGGVIIGAKVTITDVQRGVTRPVVTYTPFNGRMLALEPPSYFKTELPEADRMTYGELKRYIAQLQASGAAAIGP